LAGLCISSFPTTFATMVLWAATKMDFILLVHGRFFVRWLHTMPKRPTSDGCVFPYTDDRGIRRWFVATGNVYHQWPSHVSLVTAAVMIFRNQDITGTPWSDEPALPFSSRSVRSRLPATDFNFSSHQI
jgi:hypothetical protein